MDDKKKDRKSAMRPDIAVNASERLLRFAEDHLEHYKTHQLYQCMVGHYDTVIQNLNKTIDILNQIKQLYCYPVDATSSSSADTTMLMQDFMRMLMKSQASEKQMADVNASSKNPDVSNTSKKKRHGCNWGKVLSDYRNAVKQIWEYSYQKSVSAKCAEYISRWFQAIDYALDRNNRKDYKFNPEKISSIIPQIVLAVGYCIETNTLSDFDASFDIWEHDVKYGCNTFSYPSYIASMLVKLEYDITDDKITVDGEAIDVNSSDGDILKDEEGNEFLRVQYIDMKYFSTEDYIADDAYSELIRTSFSDVSISKRGSDKSEYLDSNALSKIYQTSKSLSAKYGVVSNDSR